MDKFTENIKKVDSIICANIAKREVSADDGLLAQNVLAQLRNFVEAVAIKIYSENNSVALNQSGTKAALAFIRSRDDLAFLRRFHQSLNITDSHLSVEPSSALRLMWNYCDLLVECKNYLKTHFDLDVLANIDDFPLDDDNALREYHIKIADKLAKTSTVAITESPTNRFYIVKKKPFFVDGQRYYELTLLEAYNKTSKFDRIIAFTKLNIPTDYAVHLRLVPSDIEIIGRNMPLKIVVGYKVSIRPCEFDNYFRLLGHKTNVETGSREYSSLMTYLTKTKLNLTDIVQLDYEDFCRVKNKVCDNIAKTPIFDGLELIRQYRGKAGYNVLIYLLYKLKNNVIKAQYDVYSNCYLSDLCLKNKCIPFDTMPYANNLTGFTTDLFALYNCIDVTGREHELLARKIKNNTETKGELYTPISELSGFGDIESLIAKYNTILYSSHKEANSLKSENGQVFISGYENDCLHIIRRLSEMTTNGCDDYASLVEEKLKSFPYQIDDSQKEKILTDIFAGSRVGLIYGSAGTGKSTMIKYLSELFRGKNIVYLANTHAAVENLRRNCGESDEIQYYTVKKYLSSQVSRSCDVLFIDECSTVSNADMAMLLRLACFDLLVLVGDVFQIESIKYGNWFYMVKSILPTKAVFELTYVHRSSEQELKTLWDSVRKLDGKASSLMTVHGMCAPVGDDSLFEKFADDEIVLCLNYDGLYGINNLNRFLQDNNCGKAVSLGQETYKEGDPIVFKETTRFGNYLYNNLKGRIVKIDEESSRICFWTEIDAVVDGDMTGLPFEVEEPMHDNKSVVSFYVGKSKNTDNDDDDEYCTVPFQVAYAVSIHKAQGLEYDSVKIVITDEAEELITHNIFYTAITRAKKKLKVYWDADTEQHIFSDMHQMFNKRDAGLLVDKFGLKRI